MNPKAITHLTNVRDPEFFKEIAEGLRLVHDNATKMAGDAKLLIEQKRRLGSRALRVIAEEEAAKLLILLDAVRCPRRTNEQKQRLSQHLRGFNKHLAKGIYVEVCRIIPATFEEVVSYVEGLRPSHYLDGPEGFEWIYRNQILQEREDVMYVNYVAYENTPGREEHAWSRPSDHLDVVFPALESPFKSAIFRLVNALHALGLYKKEALEVVAEIWRPLEMPHSFHFSERERLTRQTLEEMERRGFLVEQPDEVYSVAIHDWPFPLYSVNLEPKEVKRSELQESQRREIEAWELATWY